MSEWRPTISPTTGGRFEAMITRPRPGDHDQIARGYDARSFATRAAAEKSAWDYIAKHRMNAPPDTRAGVHHFKPAAPSGQNAGFEVGTVVHFRGRKGRRYVIVRVEPSYGGIGRYSLRALSGGRAGSGPSGTKENEIERDADQSRETSGASAGWLAERLPAAIWKVPAPRVEGRHEAPPREVKRSQARKIGKRHGVREAIATRKIRAEERAAFSEKKAKPSSQAEWLAQFGIKE